MHKLDRTAVPAPICLGHYDHGTQTWGQLHPECKRLVRLALQRMQGQYCRADDADDAEYVIWGLRCAYCESQIFYGGHIEHFRRKNRHRPDAYPELTFAWDNLFLACGATEHCGHYKDRPSAAPYDPDDLIKPDEHNPDAFLFFHSRGSVLVRDRTGMTDVDRHRALETIRVFNLNCGHLRGARKKSLNAYRAKNPGLIDELMTFDEVLRREYILSEIEATKWDPFSTTIKHFFEANCCP